MKLADFGEVIIVYKN